MCGQWQVISKPCLLFASISSSRNGLTGFCIPNPKLFLRGLCPHLCQESYHPWERLSSRLHPLLHPQTPNYLQMVLSWSFSILPNALTDPTLSLMTPCCLPLREGRGLTQPACGFCFHCVRPQGPDSCPAACRAGTKGHSDPCLFQPQTPCAPHFGDPEASCQRVSWRWEPCPWLGRSPLPRPLFLDCWISSAGAGADQGGVVLGFPGPGPHGLALG